MKNALLWVVVLSVCALASDKSDKSDVARDYVSNAVRAADLLRARMVDPDSMVIEHVYAKPSKPGHPLLCIPYRSRNGFGGYSHGVAE